MGGFIARPVGSQEGRESGATTKEVFRIGKIDTRDIVVRERTPEKNTAKKQLPAISLERLIFLSRIICVRAPYSTLYGNASLMFFFANDEDPLWLAVKFRQRGVRYLLQLLVATSRKG